VDAGEGLVHFEDAETSQRYSIEAPLLFATDGAFSAVRSSLQRTPGFNYAQSYIDYGYKELHLPPDEAGRHRLDPNALHIWPRGKFMLIALPNTDGSFTCTLFLPFEGPHSFVSLSDEAAVPAFLSAHFPDLDPLLPELVKDFQRNPTAGLMTVRCSPWHFNGKVLLLGDASHAIVPFFGQGMNAGFEDCTILSELMDTYQEDWPSIMAHFNRQRIPDANAIADLALENFIEMRDKVADPQFLLWKKVEKFLQDRYPDRYRSVYSMVSFSHVPYHLAWQEVAAQDKLRLRIMDLPDLGDRWDSPQVEAVFEDWYRNRGN
jgi:kynurenine 3-monooxygenase